MWLTQSAGKSCERVTIGFGFTSDWMKRWRESFKPIASCRKCKTNYFSTLKWKPLYLDGLGWKNLISNREKHKAILVFKSLRNLAPVYLRQMFCEFSANYDLRNSINKHALRKARIEYLKRSFSYSGAALWNSPSQNLRECNSLGVFKKKLRSYYSSSGSHRAIM